jgi:NAD(P)H-nitrite reductase large subunit
MQSDSSNWALRSKEFLEKHEIIYLLKKTVFSVIPEMQNVVCADGDHIQYDKLCIATGSQADRPKIENI